MVADFDLSTAKRISDSQAEITDFKGQIQKCESKISAVKDVISALRARSTAPIITKEEKAEIIQDIKDNKVELDSLNAQMEKLLTLLTNEKIHLHKLLESSMAKPQGKVVCLFGLFGLV
jgi:chromosome segregation ATPase